MEAGFNFILRWGCLGPLSFSSVIIGDREINLWWFFFLQSTMFI